MILFHLENQLYINNFLNKYLDCLSVKTFYVEQFPPKWWQLVWENYSSGVTIPDRVSEQTIQGEQIPWIEWELVS